MSQTVTGYTMDTVDIRLTSSITTSSGSLGDRSGVRLRLTTNEAVGIGASAPIPGAHQPTHLEDLARNVREWADGAVGHDLDSLLASLDTGEAPPPVSRFAIHTALGDLAAREAGVPLRQWLRAGSPDSVPINVLIADEAPKAVHAAVGAAVAEGVRAVKLKVGAADTGLDATRIIAASEAGGTATALRLDANRGWTRDEAIRVIGRVGPYRIDYLEDPTGDPSEYGSIEAETGVAMAFDAPAERSMDLHRLLDETGASVLVVKAAAVGGVDRILDVARKMGDQHRLVISSALDGPIGLLAGLQAAAALPDSDVAHGLGTGGLVRGMPTFLLPVRGIVHLGPDVGLSALD